MDLKNFIENLRKLDATERYQILFGEQKIVLEERLKCRILTLPLEYIGNLPLGLFYLLVTDPKKKSSHVAVLKFLES